MEPRVMTRSESSSAGRVHRGDGDGDGDGDGENCCFQAIVQVKIEKI